MADAPTLSSVLNSVRPLVQAGASLHWLVPFEKRPINAKWSSLPRLDLPQLEAAYRPSANIGIRLGEPSKIGALYLMLIDVDIRKIECEPEVWAELIRLIPEARTLPSVISGSGGASRHLYLLSGKPFRKSNLAKSKGFEMVWNEAEQKHEKKHDWMIDLYGTGVQAVLPPSIHPDTRKPYLWERPLDLDLLEFGIGPIIDSKRIEAWGLRAAEAVAAGDSDDDDLEALFAQSPLDLDDEEIERTLRDLPADWVDDYWMWVDVGMALHHQFEGGDDGLALWKEWSSSYERYSEKACDDKWPSLAWKPRHKNDSPKTFRSLIQAANANRLAGEHDFDLDLGDDSFDAGPKTGTALVVANDYSLDDLLGDGPPPPAAEAVVTAQPKIDPDWQNLLHRNEEGELKSTLHNMSLIVRNDIRMHGVAAINEFTQEIALRNPPRRVKKKRESGWAVVNLEGRIWQVLDRLNGDPWSDSHDTAIRAIIEAPTTQGGYGIKVTDRDLKGAIDTAAQIHAFHPVREELLRETWDGQRRAETMFIDYLGCPDTPYHRKASWMTLLGAVTRVFEPGHKFDFVPILEGVQGKGKSTFIRILGLEWYNELTGEISDPRQMVEVMQGSWVMEIGELSSMHRSEVNELKAFVSRTRDRARPAYAKRAQTYPRQCIFIGSTNDDEYLRDQTGGRRFWPIKCNLPGQIDNRRFETEVRQIWAEVVQAYQEMRRRQPTGELPLYLDDAAAAQEAALIQESRRIETAEDVLAGQIAAWLGRPVDDGTGFDDLDPEAPKVYRETTCTAEIWVEVMGGRVGQMPQNEATKIGRAMHILGWKRSNNVLRSHPVNDKYGPCRVYLKAE